MPQVPYYGSHYRFTEPPPPEPAKPSVLGLDPLSILIIAAAAWWGWKKGWWGRPSPRTVPAAQTTLPEAAK
jgi:hypothetical protein